MFCYSSLFNQILRRSLQPRIKDRIKFCWTTTTSAMSTSSSSVDTTTNVPGENSQSPSVVRMAETGSAVKHGRSEDFADPQQNKKLKSDSEKADSGEVAPHRQRRKVAVLMAYSGQGYSGMQKNAGVKTIEDELLQALLKAELISEENYHTPQSMQFQRAARTDKGVSAARQVVSFRVVVSDGLAEKINTHLPPQIQVLNVTRTTKGFNSKFWCDARTYSYTLPTFAFAPITELTTEDYRITDDVIKKVRDVLAMFKGTHNFHNFTSGRKPGDASAQRFIMEFECGEPFVEEGLEIVTIKVRGQSFMLHQIRKMIGLTIAILRDLTNVKVIDKTWTKDKIDMPIAPGLGLVLEEVHYDKYNKRYANDGLHDALEWSDLDKTVEEFKRRHIHPTIVNCEKTEKSMLQWLATLPLHSYDIREPGPHQSQFRTEFGRAMVGLELHQKKEEQLSTENSTATTADKDSPASIPAKDSSDEIAGSDSSEKISSASLSSTTVPETSQEIPPIAIKS